MTGAEQLQAELADPERIRREAIGAYVQKCKLNEYGDVVMPTGVTSQAETLFTDALAAGESAVTGEAPQS